MYLRGSLELSSTRAHQDALDLSSHAERRH